MKKILSLGLAFVCAAFILTFSSSCKKTVTRTVTDTLRRAWQPLPIYNINGMAALSARRLF